MSKKQYEPAGRSFTEVIRSILNETPSSAEGDANTNENVGSNTEKEQAVIAENQKPI